MGQVVQAVQEVTGQTVELAYVDQGYTGEAPAAAAAEHGVKLEVVKLPETKRGFVLLPRRWVVGGGTFLRLDGAGSAAGARLRTAADHLGRAALYCLYLPDVDAPRLRTEWSVCTFRLVSSLHALGNWRPINAT